MIYEDGIPVSSMISEPMLLGNDVYAAEGNLTISSVVTPCSEETYNNNSSTAGYY
jgi:hypothetical protein